MLITLLYGPKHAEYPPLLAATSAITTTISLPLTSASLSQS